MSSKNKEICLHFIVSNIIMLVIPLMSVGFDLYSNQIYAFKSQIMQSNNFNIQINSIIKIYKQQKQYKQQLQMGFIQRWLMSYVQFDGYHYFQNSYQYQTNFVFMKGYTTLVSTAKQISKFVIQNAAALLKNEIEGDLPKINLLSSYLAILILIFMNKTFFILSAFKLQSLSKKIFKNETTFITILYIYNPSIIFFHSIYSQSLFCLLTFSAIDIYLQSQQRQGQNYVPFKVLLMLFLSISVRSNGIFLISIVGVPLLFQLFNNMRLKLVIKITKSIVYGVLILVVLILPIIAYSYYIYHQICENKNSKPTNQALLDQCSKWAPNLYSYIQNKYWSVGFMKYYTFNNIIFIFIGFPAILISISSFFTFYQIVFANYHEKQGQQQKCKQLNINMAGFYQINMVGFHLSFWILLIISTFFANVQSSTRFLCSHPIFYVCLAKALTHKIIRIWMISYCLIGSVMFCIGFPWT